MMNNNFLKRLVSHGDWGLVCQCGGKWAQNSLLGYNIATSFQIFTEKPCFIQNFMKKIEQRNVY